LIVVTVGLRVKTLDLQNGQIVELGGQGDVLEAA
jgi:hypothetical protein